MRAQLCVPPAEPAIADLARRQHGVVARSQLLDLGFGRSAIGRRLESGRLHQVHRGVYAVGHTALSREGRWMAAVLAGGPGAVLSDRCAGARWGIRSNAPTHVEIRVPRRLGSRAGIIARAAVLAPDEVTVVDGIPVTTVARTLLDLSAVVSPRELERALHEAEVLRLGDAAGLQTLVARYPRRRGVAVLRAILASARLGAEITRSELEERFLALVTAAGLPRPRLNVALALGDRVLEVDCVWPAARLVVELDGHASHSTSAAFERDRARDRALQAHGWRVARITWRQLHGQPAAVISDLRTLLGRYAQAR